MKIDLAVYTADRGFDWQPGTVYPRSELIQYKAIMGRFPNILLDKVPYGGVFVCNGKLVFYRYHIHVKGDFAGRDAFYCVLGTVPLAKGKKIDLEKVFNTPEFSTPMRPFPLSVEIDEISLPEPSTLEELEYGVLNVSSLTQIGIYATFFGEGKFVCRIDGGSDCLSYDVVCEGADFRRKTKSQIVNKVYEAVNLCEQWCRHAPWLMFRQHRRCIALFGFLAASLVTMLVVLSAFRRDSSVSRISEIQPCTNETADVLSVGVPESIKCPLSQYDGLCDFLSTMFRYEKHLQNLADVCASTPPRRAEDGPPYWIVRGLQVFQESMVSNGAAIGPRIGVQNKVELDKDSIHENLKEGFIDE